MARPFETVFRIDPDCPPACQPGMLEINEKIGGVASRLGELIQHYEAACRNPEPSAEDARSVVEVPGVADQVIANVGLVEPAITAANAFADCDQQCRYAVYSQVCRQIFPDA
jgi:hypothetical protein